VKRSYAKAARWYRKAADAGYADAQNDLGFAYYSARGVPRNYSQALFWFRKGAEQGEAHAKFNLGCMYRDGRGVPQDRGEALRWFRAAADQGDADAQSELASLGPKMPREQIAEALPATPGNARVQSSSGAMNAKGFVAMLLEGGVYKVPVLINDTITLKFVLDSGATDVTIPADVVTTLMRSETITKSDFIGVETYTLADGSKTSSPTFRIRSLKVGDMALQNVMGSVARREGDLLLGQSFLGRFKSWSIDNTTHTLVLEPSEQ
ncbi:MAG: retroviral-like aspartic protease family protein, partial [Bryobacteraceae bacterium]|jgi:predicted aspartyl protease